MVRPEPVAQQVGLALGCQRAQAGERQPVRRGDLRQIGLRQCVEYALGLRRMPGAAREGGRETAGRPPPAPAAGAPESGCASAPGRGCSGPRHGTRPGWPARRESPPPAPPAAADGRPRPGGRDGRHRRQPGQTGAAAQAPAAASRPGRRHAAPAPHWDTRWCHRRRAPPRPAPGSATCAQPLPGFHQRAMARIDAAHDQRHAEFGAQRDTMVLEIVGSLLQAVVHMDGHHLPRPTTGTGQQQGAGVGAAAERHRQRQRRCKAGHGHRHDGLRGHGALPGRVGTRGATCRRPWRRPWCR